VVHAILGSGSTEEGACRHSSLLYIRKKNKREIYVFHGFKTNGNELLFFVSLSLLSSLITPMNPNPTTQSLSSESGDFSSSSPLSLSLHLHGYTLRFMCWKILASSLVSLLYYPSCVVTIGGCF
jgi:hypothetical protein